MLLNIGPLQMNYQTIITPDQLLENINNPNWLILDCRSTSLNDPEAYQVYDKGHIANASYCFINSTFYNDDSVSEMSGFSSSFDLVLKELHTFGFNIETQLIIYGDSDGAITDQIWLFMRSIGYTDTAVLQGGFESWQDQGYPVSNNKQSHLPQNTQACSAAY